MSGRIEDKEITLPIPLNFVSDHRPRMSCVLEHHWHASRHSYSPTQHVVDGPDTFETWREVGCDPSHYLLSSTVCFIGVEVYQITWDTARNECDIKFCSAYPFVCSQ